LNYSLLSSAVLAPLVLATLVGVGGAVLGLWLTGIRRRARAVVPFSAGVLLGIVAFGLLPELVTEVGGWGCAFLFVLGYGVLLAISRFVYPICPSCAHGHDHTSCETVLHGFAGPLISAAALHSFLDGWSVVTAQIAAPASLRLAVPLAVALHKVPEGIALGGIARAALPSRGAALAWCILAESCTLVGGLLGLLMAPSLGARWTAYPLGIAAGWLAYLGYHAIHEEWRRRGAAPAFMPALTGVAGAAALQQGVRAWFR
jgi:zinc transporter ZupT